LLLANIDSIKKGSKVAHLQNFDTTEYVDIELNPSKSASANAEDYFKRARKAASSVNILTARLESTKRRLTQLKAAEKYKDNFEEFEAELTTLRLISKKAGPIKRKVVEPRLPYKRFRSSSGWEIWVGRTNRDNDELTFKLAKKDDYWFHAWQAAGSHTVLRLPDKKSIPDKQTLLEAASLAAYFSKARTSSKVPVAYTQVRFVHKPRNFPPGKVTVDKEKELMVKPADPEKFMIRDEE
jgi:predicted ribosome quality control (RQC) complex YloA/Tae2 family protein